ncbi:MAG: hypothetical protein KF799_06730 [Bdellovibrionales bacterium]|nr:hypothetical protein [Bdellovibrionales bacterium]
MKKVPNFRIDLLLERIKRLGRLMKVQELIEKLRTFDPESLVVTRGLDEDGFADIRFVEAIHVRERESEYAREIIGEYESSKDGKIPAILIDHS